MPRGVSKLHDDFVQYTFRVDKVDGVDNDSIAAFLRDCDGPYVVVHEVAEKTGKLHYQGWIWTKINNGTWKKRVTTRFGVKSSQFAVAPVAKDMNWQRYCMKGVQGVGVDVVCRYGIEYTDEWIQKEHELYWEENAKLKEAKKNYKKQTLMQEAIEQCRKLQPVTYRSAAQVVIAIAKAQKRAVDVFMLKRVVNGVMLQLDPTFKGQLLDAVLYDASVSIDKEMSSHNVQDIVGDIDF